MGDGMVNPRSFCCASIIQRSRQHFVILCREVKLFTEAFVAIDGSKFKAINNREHHFTLGKIERRERELEDSVQHYLDALETADRTQPQAGIARSAAGPQQVQPVARGSCVHHAWHEAAVGLPSSTAASMTGSNGLQSSSVADQRMLRHSRSNVRCTKGRTHALDRGCVISPLSPVFRGS
jgi:hypothetical protein